MKDASVSAGNPDDSRLSERVGELEIHIMHLATKEDLAKGLGEVRTSMAEGFGKVNVSLEKINTSIGRMGWIILGGVAAIVAIIGFILKLT